jgi:hypothetical protein
MAQVLVSNNYVANNPDIPVLADQTAAPVANMQVVRIDVGAGTTESRVNASNPMPVTVNGSSATALVASAPTAVSVGVTTTSVVAANSARRGLYLSNTSTNRISIAFGHPAVLDSGITIYPQGLFWMDAFSFSTAQVNAIAAGAASNLAIQELV